MMKEELNNMDKIFREKLEGFREEPPAFVWDNIQATLAGRKHRKRMAWYSWSAVAALLVLAFIAGWYFNDTAEKATPQVADREVVSQKDGTTIPEKDIVTNEFEFGESEIEKITPEKVLVVSASREDDRELVSERPEDQENRELFQAFADQNYMNRIEPRFAEIAVGNQTAELPGESKKTVSSVFPSWEQQVMEKNALEMAHKTKNPAGWKLGLSVSPGYASYSAKHGATYASNMTYEANDGNANLSGGISVQYKTGSRVSVESGVYYAQNGQQTGSSPLFSGSRAEYDYMDTPAGKLYFNTAVNLVGNRMAMNSTAGIIEFEGVPKGAEIAANLESSGTYANSLLTSGELSQVFDFVEIPLYLRYLLIDRKMDVEIVGGVNAGLVVGNNAYIDNEYGLQNIGKTRDISTLNLSGTLGLGMNYALGKNLSVAVEPRVNYYLNSINRNPDVDFRPYRIGVYTGLYYEF